MRRLFLAAATAMLVGSGEEESFTPQRCASAVATAPNEVWSWDITKLRGPRKWTYFYLYVLLDIDSHYAVGWNRTTTDPGST